MSVLTLPLVQDALVFRFQTTLDQKDFIFRFYFNQSDSSWYFDLTKDDGTPLLTGIKVVLGTLLTPGINPDLPAGKLLAVDLTKAGQEATSTDLGSRVKIFYVEAA